MTAYTNRSTVGNSEALLLPPSIETGCGGRFRNSKLTHLLQDSLSGNAKTVVIACLSPGEVFVQETLSTLQFARTCKRVRTKARKNLTAKGDLVQQLTEEVKELKVRLFAFTDCHSVAVFQKEIQVR